jgi:large subunit ribosomal protein L24
VKIKKGDLVRVLSGKDRGKEGEVMSVDPRRSRAVVDGVHMAKKHQRPTAAVESGGIIDIAMPIHVSNLAVVCPKTGEPGRVGYRMEGDKKIRFHKKSGEELA